MESIGMTQWQILKVLIREGILYAGGAWLVTMSVGMAAVYEIYHVYELSSGCILRAGCSASGSGTCNGNRVCCHSGGSMEEVVRAGQRDRTHSWN